MTTSPKLPKGKSKFASYAERFITIHGFLAAVIGIAIGVGGSLLTGKVWIRTIIRNEIKLQGEPTIKLYEADSRFYTDREDDGFRTLDEVLTIYETRKNDFSRDEYENALHKYLYHLSLSQKPDLNQYRFEKLLQRFRDGAITSTLEDQINIGWFRFSLGQLSDARQTFDKVARIATAERSDQQADAYFGLFYCSLAKGDTQEAMKFIDSACASNPYQYRFWAFNGNNALQARYASLYERFAETARFIGEESQRRISSNMSTNK